MADDAPTEQPQSVLITQLNVKPEGSNVRAIFSMCSMHEYPNLVSQVRTMESAGWEIDTEKSVGGSVLHVVIPNASLTSVVDKVREMNVRALRPMPD